MARRIFPRDGERLVVAAQGFRKPLLGGVGVSFQVFVDQAASELADIQTLDGTPIADSRLTVGADSAIGPFLGPDDDSEVLWLRQVGGTRVEAISATPSASARLLTPVVTVSASDFTLANTGVDWADLDTASSSPGTASARPMDVVIPNVAAGDVIGFEPNGIYNNGSGATFLRAVTVVAGTVVNSLSGSDIVPTWTGGTSVADRISGEIFYTLQSGDIENGAVRVRVQYLKNTASTRSIYGSTLNYRLRSVGRGPF